MSAEEARPARSECPEKSNARSPSGRSERTPAASAVCLTRRATWFVGEPLGVDSLVVLEDAPEQRSSCYTAEANPALKSNNGASLVGGPAATSTSRHPVLPRSVTRTPWSGKISIQPAPTLWFPSRWSSRTMSRPTISERRGHQRSPGAKLPGRAAPAVRSPGDPPVTTNSVGLGCPRRLVCRQAFVDLDL